MSTESYVNRVNQGPHFEALKPVEETEATVDQIATPSEDPEQKLGKVGAAPVFEAPRDVIDSVVEKAAVDLNYGTPVEEPNDNIGNGGLPSLTSLIVSRTEFERFKIQVIVAFKHLGLDTRRFFKD